MFHPPRSVVPSVRAHRPAPWLSRTGSVSLLCTAWLLSACAGVPVPNAQMAAAEAALRSASASPTPKWAPAELQLARDKLASAQRALVAQDNTLAGQLAEEVVLDAQVAELHAEALRSRQAAQEARAAARALQEELNRKPLH